MAEAPHLTVLLDETVEAFAPAAGKRILDLTLGWGGHSEALLRSGASVLGVDRDPDAIAAATARLAPFGDRFTPLHSTFGDALKSLAGPFDGILADLGVSSPQIDRPERGFSFRFEAPLDMRMSQSGLTAAELLEQVDEPELTRILRSYGEERHARRIARAILAAMPVTTTSQLAAVVADAMPGGARQKINPATRTFQALRIAVNDELGQLRQLLERAPDLLAPGGRVAIISFHSLEDAAVKARFRELSGVGTPRDPYGNPVVPPLGRLVTRKAVQASDGNPRARSARLRVWEKT
jgi:16S rRNA (cytosine1402-N4)-methyltransferase